MNVPYTLNYFPHGQKPAGEMLQTTAEVSLCGVNYTAAFGKYEAKTLCYAEGVIQEQAYIC